VILNGAITPQTEGTIVNNDQILTHDQPGENFVTVIQFILIDIWLIAFEKGLEWWIFGHTQSSK
jgi:hypothetical protein